MTYEEQRAALVKLADDQAKLDALKMRVLVEADRSGATSSKGDGSAAEWVAGETRQTRREARSDLRLGRRLEKYTRLGRACDTGAVNAAQARAIVTSLDRLPKTGQYSVGAEQLVEAEEHLIAKAADFDAERLKVIGWRIFEVIAPEVAETWEGKKLAAQEARALRKTEFRMWTDPQGITHGRFRVPELHGRMLNRMLTAFMNLDRPVDSILDAGGVDPELPAETRRGLAFMELIEGLTDNDAPSTGGCGATVVVTMTLAKLLVDLDAAGVVTLDDGGRISAAETRRLACNAGIIPMVLGGKSEILDQARRQRFHNRAQRIAMGVRDGGCTEEHCDKPASMTQAHHDIPWSQNGHTNVETGRLLCPHHHRRIHDPAYTREPGHASLYSWPVMAKHAHTLSRDEALASSSVMIVRPDMGSPMGLRRGDIPRVTTTKRDLFHLLNWESLRPNRSDRLVDTDSPVLHWSPAPLSEDSLHVSEIGSQAGAMRKVSVEYERWINRVMSWVRRRGTKVWGLETAHVRPDLDIDLDIVSNVYALPDALRLLESGARAR